MPADQTGKPVLRTPATSRRAFRGVKQDTVDYRLVVEGEVGDRRATAHYRASGSYHAIRLLTHGALNVLGINAFGCELERTVLERFGWKLVRTRIGNLV